MSHVAALKLHPCSVLIFQTTIGGTTFFVAVYSDGDEWKSIARSSTDAGAVLNAAITTLGANGGEIFACRGIYPILTMVSVNEGTNVWIYIQGEGVNTILRLGDDISIFHLYGPTWISELKLEGVKGTHTAVTNDGIIIDYISCYIWHVRIEDFAGCGISTIGTVAGGKISECHITQLTSVRSANSRCIEINDNATDFEIFNCVLSQCELGILLDDGSNTIESCHLWGCLVAIDIGLTASVTMAKILDCFIENNQQHGIRVDTRSCWDGVFSNNTFWKNGQAAANTYDDFYIHITTPYRFSNNVITSNDFDGDNQTRYAINITSWEGRFNVISNNAFKQHGTAPFTDTGGANYNKLSNNEGLNEQHVIQTGVWAAPTTGNSDILGGDWPGRKVGVYNSTQGAYRLYVYLNAGWRFVALA